jgi:hypothetical protein
VPKAKKEAPAVEEDLAPLEDAENELDESLELGDDDDEDDDDDEPLEIPASPQGKASALRLIDLLVEKGGLAMANKTKRPGAELIDAVAKILEAPGSLSARASKLSEAIVESEEVDDLFVDDDVLAEILKRW